MGAPAGVAQTEPSAAGNPIGVELRYEAFAGCPEREAFAKNLEARRRGAVMTQGAVQLEVRLRRSELRGVEGSIVVSSDSGVPSARRIAASTCSEAADALALIAALALQGIEVEEVPAGDDANPDKTDRRAGRSRESEDRGRERTSEAQQRVAGTEPASDPSTEAGREPEAERATEAEVVDDRVGTELQTPPEESTEEDSVEPSPEGATRAYVLLSGGVASGVLPALQPLPELSLSWEHGAHDFPVWSVHAGFRISPEQTRRFDQGVVAVSWWTGLSALCLGVRGSQLAASGCATLEVGALSGGGTETDNPRRERGAWVALGPGATIAYDIAPALRIQLRAEVLTPLTRYRLELPEGTAVHEASTLGLRAELGAGLRLW